MCAIFLLVLISLISSTNVYGQTAEERRRFVDQAMNRITTAIQGREAKLNAGLEQLKTVQRDAQRNLEEAIADRNRTQQKLADYEKVQREIARMPDRHAAEALESRMRLEAAAAEQQKSEFFLRETTLRAQVTAWGDLYTQKEVELRNVAARDSAIKVELNSLNQTWHALFNQQSFAKLLGVIVTAARELAITSNVKFTSESRDGKATSGARVRFQGDDERRNGTTARYSCLTGCAEENLDIGFYYFWTERSGRATSDSSYGKFVVAASDTIQLVEDR